MPTFFKVDDVEVLRELSLTGTWWWWQPEVRTLQNKGEASF